MSATKYTNYVYYSEPPSPRNKPRGIELKDGRVVQLRFRHLRNGITRAAVQWKAVWVRAYGGSAHCSREDNFCYLTGRKIALRRAMAEAGDLLDKEDRRRIWQHVLSKWRGPARAAMQARLAEDAQ